MHRGATSQTFTAAVGAIDAWLERARSGESFVYARCHSWTLDRGVRAHVQALHDDGEVVPVQRRCGELTEYIIQRRAEASRPRHRLGVPAIEPPPAPPRVEELGAEAVRLMSVLRMLILQKQACPSNARLAEMAELKDRHQAAYHLTRLKDAGLITIELLFAGAARAPRDDVRVITITATSRSTLRPERKAA